MSNWEKKRLDACADVRMGQSPDSSSYNEEGQGLPFLQGCAEFGPKYPTHRIYTSQVTRTAPSHSILISVRAPVGALNYSLEEYCIGRGLGSIKSFNGDLDTWYLYYYIKQNVNRLERISQGSTFEAINSNDLKSFIVDLPPLSERKKIAKILQTVDGQIEKTEAIITKYKAIKQGLRQDLFTRGIDVNTGKIRNLNHQEFQNIRGFVFPNQWKCVKVGDYLLNIEQGWSPNCEGESATIGEWGVLKTTAVTWEGYSELENKKLPYNLKPRPEYEVRNDDVLITRAGPNSRVGVVAYVKETRNKLMFSDKLYRLITKQQLLPEYLAYALSSNFTQTHLSTFKTGMAESQTNISQVIIKSLELLLPSEEEQKQIIEKLNSIDTLLQKEKNSLDKLNQLKKGLMADLLSGKVRVQVEDASNPKFICAIL